MKTDARYPELIAIKVTREQAEEIRRAAAADDRPVSHFLRRLLAQALPPAESKDKTAA